MAEQAQFPDSPRGWHSRWKAEFTAAQKALKEFHSRGEKIIRRFRDERDDANKTETRWNLFTANIQTLEAMLFGQTPKTNCTRKFADADDDLARVGAEILERNLNAGFDVDDGAEALALKHALSDRLLPGLGLVRVLYDAQFETQEVPPQYRPDPLTGQPMLDEKGQPVVLAPGYTREVKVDESVEAVYSYWADMLWDAGARTFGDVRWWGFKAPMSREALVERFGEEIGNAIPLNAKKAAPEARSDDAQQATPWDRAEIWEVWSKETREVFWLCLDYPAILDRKPDPLGLKGFWPFPRPLMANLTTSSLVPVADFVLAQDLYDEIDDVSERITLLEQAIRVAGAYDGQCKGLERLLTEEGGSRNVLIPVANWGIFKEQGGMRGAIEWMPLEQVVAALDKLREYRGELVGALYQQTGMSDIMRGAAAAGGVTATEQAIKARFGSVRAQKLQDDFARFCSDVQRLKAEIICKHFDAATILRNANAGALPAPDRAIAPQAAELLKSQLECYRVEVKPEAVSLTDFAALKQERMEVLTGITQFLQAAAPLMQAMPGSSPYLLEMLQWTVAGLRGASQIEGVLDRAIAFVEQSQQQGGQPGAPQIKPPDPKLLAQQQKAQNDLQKTQADLQADLVRINAETQANDQRQADQTKWNIREQQMRDELKRQQAGGVAVGPPAPFAPPDLGGAP